MDPSPGGARCIAVARVYVGRLESIGCSGRGSCASLEAGQGRRFDRPTVVRACMMRV